MKKYLAIFGVLLAVAAIVAFNSLFTVHQTTQALILQLGNPVRVVKDPGLHFKTPFIQNVELYDSRILDLDPPPPTPTMGVFQGAAGTRIRVLSLC